MRHLRTSHGVFGAERVILGLLASSDAGKFDTGVTLISSEPGLNSDFIREVERLGFKAENFPMKGRLDIAGARSLRRHIREQGIDLIHCHDFKANFYGLLATVGTGVKRVTTLHGSTADSMLLRLYLALNEYFLIRFFDRVITVSPHLADELRFIDPKKVSVVPNGLDIGIFDRAGGADIAEPALPRFSGKTVMGSVGRLFPDKGHEDLIEALSLLKDGFPDLVLLIVGDGPHRAHLEARRDRLGLRDRVVFAGVRRGMKEVYRAMDIFVMPSHREGLPMALLEAMLAGRPVVATRVGAIPGVLGGGLRGRVVEPNDPEGLAREVAALLRDRAAAVRMAADAEAYVRSEYSSETMARRTESLYSEAIGMHNIFDKDVRGTEKTTSRTI